MKHQSCLRNKMLSIVMTGLLSIGMIPSAALASELYEGSEDEASVASSSSLEEADGSSDSADDALDVVGVGMLREGSASSDADVNDAEAISSDGAESQVLSSSKEPSPSSGNQEKSDSKTNEAQTEDSEDITALSYVYIDYGELPLGESQNIVIGLENETATPSDARLVLIEESSGEELNFSLTRSIDGAMLFELPASSFGIGAYSIKELSYSAGDPATAGRQLIDFANEDEPYGFQVVEKAEIEETDDESLDDATTAYTVDQNGSLIESGSVEEAVEEAVTAQADSGIAPFSLSGSASGQARSGGSSDLVVVLDPGHGGYDGGASSYVTEKDINLAIAQACRDELMNYAGIQVYLTRESDIYVSLQDRVQFAIDHDADLVVSIHNNSSASSSARGSEVIVPRNGSWYYQETYVTGTELGNKILSNLEALGLPGRSVYSKDCTNNSRYPDGTLSDYYTLIAGPREAGILGIIVEHAFVSNPTDAAFLSNNENLRALGRADAQAIVDQYGLTKWNLSGMNAPSNALVGATVSMSPITSGDVSAIRYNYGWQRNGSWAKGEWDSLLNSTGEYTSNTSWSFEFTRAGNYTLFINAVILDSAGNETVKRTVYGELTVAPWSLDGISGVPSSMIVGDSATISPSTTGDTSGALYNYVWQRNGSWADGDWGSTVMSTGECTSSQSWTFTPTRAGTYTLFVDVDNGSVKTTAESAPIAVGRFAATGVDCPSTASTGETVTFEAITRGDLSGATYNYVWQRNGSWDTGEWGSTILSTGGTTSSATGSFAPDRSGTYTLAVDVTVGGETQTVTSGQVVVTDPWTAEGIDGVPDAMLVGERATIEPVVTGDLAGVTYNYVWQRNGSWDTGEWGSTVMSTGDYTSSAFAIFAPSSAGTYTLYVDVQSGTYKCTVQKTVRVSRFAATGVDCPSTASTGETVTFEAITRGDLSGATYNYVWQRNGSWDTGEWGSTILSTGGTTSSATGSFAPDRSGTYTLAVDVTVGGETQTVTSGQVVVTDPWTAEGIDGVPSIITLGDTVTVVPVVTGDLAGVTYNYVWQRNGSWADGDWGSTVMSTGKSTTETSWKFSPAEFGTYTLFVDVQSGTYKRTVQTTVTVGHQIMGSSVASKQDLVNYLQDYCGLPGNSYPSIYGSKGAASPREFIDYQCCLELGRHRACAHL